MKETENFSVQQTQPQVDTTATETALKSGEASTVDELNNKSLPMEVVTDEMTEEYRKFIKMVNTITLTVNSAFSQPEEIIRKLPWGKLKLSNLQINIIYKLYHDGPAPLARFAKAEGLPKQVLTKPVNALVEKGLIRKFKKDGDMKSVHLEITEEGRRHEREQSEILRLYLKNKIYSKLTLDELREIIKHQEIYLNFLKRFDD